MLLLFVGLLIKTEWNILYYNWNITSKAILIIVIVEIMVLCRKRDFSFTMNIHKGLYPGEKCPSLQVKT